MGGHRFSEKIMLGGKLERDDDSKPRAHVTAVVSCARASQDDGQRFRRRLTVARSSKAKSKVPLSNEFCYLDLVRAGTSSFEARCRSHLGMTMRVLTS